MKEQTNKKPTPEEVARKCSINSSYYHGPCKFITLPQDLKPKRTYKEQYYYMRNRYHQCTFYIRKFTKQKKAFESIEKKNAFVITTLEHLNAKIEKLKKKLTTIIIPKLKRN